MAGVILPDFISLFSYLGSKGDRGFHGRTGVPGISGDRGQPGERGSPGLPGSTGQNVGTLPISQILLAIFPCFLFPLLYFDLFNPYRVAWDLQVALEILASQVHLVPLDLLDFLEMKEMMETRENKDHVD